MEPGYEWDENKNQHNFEHHGIRFEDALALFDGRPIYEWIARVDEELRYATTGELDGRFFTVIWTTRDKRRRLISVRRARDEEKRNYRSVHG